MRRFLKTTFLYPGLLSGVLLCAAGNLFSAGAAGDSIPVIRGERPPIDLSNVPADAFENRTIHIKFKQGTTEHFDKNPVGRAADGSVQFGFADVDNLNRVHHAKKSKLLFSGKNDRTEFSNRHRSWGFHLWHTLELDSSVDIKKIISEYQNLPEVEIAEP
jgi:hypothetical protein